MDFLGIHWAGIERFIFFPIFAIFIVLGIKNYYRIKHAVRKLANPLHQKALFKNFSLGRQRAKTLLLICSLLSIFIAILQPQWGKKEQNVQQEGRDLLIVLDISRSMQARDVKPSRLEFAKLKIRNLLSKISCDRVGLIVFSGTAFVQCPLTVDHAAFLMFLNHVDTETISSGTTAFDSALKKALDVYASLPEKKHKLVLFLTDGEDFSAHLSTMQTKSAQENIHLFALGIGSPEGAPIPKFDNSGKQIGHEVDDKGAIAMSKLNEKTLEQLCSSLHGKYIKATQSDADLNTLAGYISSYEKEKISDKTFSLFEEQYPWLLGLAWIFLALEWAL